MPKRFALTICCLTTMIAPSFAISSSTIWKYPEGTRVASRQDTFVCDTPTALDEFWALAALEAYEEMMKFDACTMVSSGTNGVVLGHIGSDYDNLMILIDGRGANIWTKARFFLTPGDWEARDCMDASSDDAANSGCLDLSDHELWLE